MTALLPAFCGAPAVDRVYHCSAETLLAALPEGSVDAIITDPPYGINKANWDAFIPFDWIEEAWRVSRRIIVMTGNPELIEVGTAIGKVQNVVVMHARNGMTRSKTGFANWFPALICGEWGWKPRQNYLPFNVSISEVIPHPSPKPLAAMEKLLTHYTEPGWTIVDPFAGSGTTLYAAQKLNRRFIGCDVNVSYVEYARDRLARPYTPNMFERAETAS